MLRTRKGPRPSLSSPTSRSICTNAISRQIKVFVLKKKTSKKAKARALAKEKEKKIPPHVDSSDEEVDEVVDEKVSREERKRLRDIKKHLDTQLDS